MEIKRNAILAMLMVTSLSSPSWAVDGALPNDALQVQKQGNISYVTGGIGADESKRLQATQNQYNLRIMNADKEGRFSGDTRILISNLQRESLLDVTRGPIFYANLPTGRHIITGYRGEQIKEDVVTISNRKPTRVRFAWPEDNE